LLALTLAKHEGCKLLTWDKALKKVARQLNVEVHGTIWLVQKLLEHEKITIERARIAFQQMINLDSRLPQSEIEKILTLETLLPA
jgi:predicted nucleic acid-binding protein